jgi:hypothetical protein
MSPLIRRWWWTPKALVSSVKISLMFIWDCSWLYINDNPKFLAHMAQIACFSNFVLMHDHVTGTFCCAENLLWQTLTWICHKCLSYHKLMALKNKIKFCFNKTMLQPTSVMRNKKKPITWDFLISRFEEADQFLGPHDIQTSPPLNFLCGDL